MPAAPAPFPNTTARSPAPRPPYPAAADDAQRAAYLREVIRGWRLGWAARASEMDAAARLARDAQFGPASAGGESALALASEVAGALQELPLDDLYRARFHGLHLEPAVIFGLAGSLIRRDSLTPSNAGDYDWESAARVLETGVQLLCFDLDRLPRGYCISEAMAPPANLKGAGPLALVRVGGELGVRLVEADQGVAPLAGLVARQRAISVLTARINREGQLDVVGVDGEFVYAWRGSSPLPTLESDGTGVCAAAFLGTDADAPVLLVESSGRVRSVGGSGPALEDRLTVGAGVAIWTDEAGQWHVLSAGAMGLCTSSGAAGTRQACDPWREPGFKGYSKALGPLWKSLTEVAVHRIAGLDTAMFWRTSAWGASFVFLDPITLQPLREPLFVRNSVMHLLAATVAGGRWLVLSAVQNGSGSEPRLAVFDLETPGRTPLPVLDLPARGDLSAPVLLRSSRDAFALLAALNDFAESGDRAARLYHYGWPSHRVTELCAAPQLEAWPVARLTPR